MSDDPRVVLFEQLWADEQARAVIADQVRRLYPGRTEVVDLAVRIAESDPNAVAALAMLRAAVDEIVNPPPAPPRWWRRFLP